MANTGEGNNEVERGKLTMSEREKIESMHMEAAEILLEYLKAITTTEDETEAVLQSVPNVVLALNTILQDL